RWIAPPPILQAFHALLAASPEATKAVPAPAKGNGLAIAEVLDKYLDWCRKHRTARTHAWYHDHLQNFLNHLGNDAGLAAEALRPFHVVEWADAHPSWSAATRRGAIIAVQRAYNWSEEMGHVTANPIKKIGKPQAGRRENHITPQDFQTILG